MPKIENKNVRFNVHFAHSDGHTSLCFQVNGEGMLTAGNDGDVRYWCLKDDDFDPRSFDIGNAVYSIAAFDSKFYVASESNELKCYSIEDGGDELTVTRFTAAVYHCDINKAGKQLVAGGGDFVVKIVNLDDYSQISLTGHEAPILCTAFDPLDEFVASSSCDGTVRVWNIADKKCIQSWDNHAKSNEMANSKTLCHICWDKSGENLYVPSNDKVCVYSRNSWENIRCFSFEGFENISVCCVCPNDEYIAASNDKGTVIIWKLKEESNLPSAIFVHPKEMPLTSVRWNPTKKDDFSFCDQNGELYCVTVTQSETLSETQMENICQGLFDDDDDLTEEVLTKVVEEPKTTEPSVVPPKVNEIISDNVAANNFDDMFEDNDNEIDIGAIKSKYEAKIFGNDAAEDENDTVEKKSSAPTADGILDDISLKSEKITKPVSPPVNLQQPFQPGSTPSSFQHRFMVWNSVGIVTSFTGEDESTIDIEFHDTTIHHSIHFTNSYNYVIADLSTEALLCANTGDEMTTSSRLFCMHFGTWDSNKEWKYDMADNEYVTALTLGAGFAAVATDQRFVRLFTVTGIQLHILSVVGPVVCLAAQEQLLSIFYHNSIGVPREQCISAKVMKVDPASTFIKQEYCAPVSLSPKSTLYWAGFTDEGTLCTVDSVGVIRLYKQLLGNSWTPILDTRRNGKSKSDHYFVVGLSEIQQQVRCLLSRGSLYPSTLPRPTLLLLDFQVPLCEMTTARSINEEQFIRQKTLNSLLVLLLKQGFDVDFQLNENDAKMSATLLKLFALALNDNSECLALNIAQLMPNKKSLELAIRYAAPKRKTSLTNKLTELMQKMDENKVRHEEEIEEVEEQTVSVSSQGLSSQLLDNKKDQLLLRPKPVNKRKQSEEDDEDVPQLRPKPVKNAAFKSTSNPFKVSGKSRNSKGFQLYLESVRPQIVEEYDDLDESEIVSTAQQMYDDLEERERKSWNAEATKRGKRKVEYDDEESNDSKKLKPTKKVTDFFNKK